MLPGPFEVNQLGQQPAQGVTGKKAEVHVLGPVLGDEPQPVLLRPGHGCIQVVHRERDMGHSLTAAEHDVVGHRAVEDLVNSISKPWLVLPCLTRVRLGATSPSRVISVSWYSRTGSQTMPNTAA